MEFTLKEIFNFTCFYYFYILNLFPMIAIMLQSPASRQRAKPSPNPMPMPTRPPLSRPAHTASRPGKVSGRHREKARRRHRLRSSCGFDPARMVEEESHCRRADRVRYRAGTEQMHDGDTGSYDPVETSQSPDARRPAHLFL